MTHNVHTQNKGIVLLKNEMKVYFMRTFFFITGNNAATNALKGIEPDSSDSSDNESKDPYKLKDELAAVGKGKYTDILKNIITNDRRGNS